MDEEDFNAYFGMGGRSWSVVLSDGTTVQLRANGQEDPVAFEERHDYGQAVIEARMNEFNEQVIEKHFSMYWLALEYKMNYFCIS